jgi:hypothetical protein
MVDECVSGVRELMNDNGYVLAQRERLLVDLIKSQNSSTLRKSLNEHVSEVLMNTLHSAVQYRLLEYSTDIV